MLSGKHIRSRGTVTSTDRRCFERGWPPSSVMNVRRFMLGCLPTAGRPRPVSLPHPSPTCAESTVRSRQINSLAEKLALHFLKEMWSGADLEDWQVWLCNAHALGQDDAEAVEECGLGGVWLGHAAQADLAVRCGRQHDIVRLNASKLVEDGAR